MAGDPRRPAHARRFRPADDSVCHTGLGRTSGLWHSGAQQGRSLRGPVLRPRGQAYRRGRAHSSNRRARTTAVSNTTTRSTITISRIDGGIEGAGVDAGIAQTSDRTEGTVTFRVSRFRQVVATAAWSGPARKTVMQQRARTSAATNDAHG